MGGSFYTNGADTDSDGFSDEWDNCAFAYNPPLTTDTPQADSGGFETTEANGRGDACECGDTSSEGSITGALDPNALLNFLHNRPNPPALTSELCSVSIGSECNALDLFTLELAFQSTGPGLQNVCRGAVGTALLNGQ